MEFSLLYSCQVVYRFLTGHIINDSFHIMGMQCCLKQHAVDKSDILIFGVIKEFHLFVNSDSVAPKCIHLETQSLV